MNTITILYNGLTLSLALGLLIILLWYDSKKLLNRYFALFIFFVMLWNVGSFLTQVAVIVLEEAMLTTVGNSILQVGFVGSSISACVFVSVLIGVYGKGFRRLAFLSLGFVGLQQVLFLDINRTTVSANQHSVFIFGQPLSASFYLLFNGITIFLLWHYRRKVRLRYLVIGIWVFLVGQFLVLLNPELFVASLSTSISSTGALLVSFVIVQREIITPLVERISQVEAMHRVSLAVSSRITIDALLDEIVSQAVGWLNADAAGFFLRSERVQGVLRLVTSYHFPPMSDGTEIVSGQGIVRTVAVTQQTIFVENYNRDWTGKDDFEWAKQTIGSLICVPLLYGGETIGVLLVISGQQGRLFDWQDVHRLELLAAQAAVAISHSYLFRQQQALAKEVGAAHRQLEAVLTSTNNPVIAVDRQLNIIFANPAASDLVALKSTEPISRYLPREFFPKKLTSFLRAIHSEGSDVYEVNVNNRVYLCHIAPLGTQKIEGWVALLNDVTELKELDRMKSEMMRMASHDLKNPLMGAMAYVELLKDDLGSMAQSEVHETVLIIERQLDRMNRIIRGVLDFERLKAGQLALEVCYPEAIVKSALGELQQFIKDRRSTILVSVQELLPGFMGDPEKFERVLVNIIENAVKFSLNEGVIRINVYLESDEIWYEVSDNGVGIPESVQPYVFDRFFRGQQKGVEHVTGSGLGLSLVKVIVEAHGGKIWFVSRKEGGTTFYVTVPVVREVVGES